MIEICPNCGAEVPPDAQACPECGSDEQTGWSNRADYGRLGVPDPEFDYNEFVREEFGPDPPSSRSLSWVWLLVAGLLVATLIALLLR